MTPHTQTITACPLRNDGHNAEGVPGDCYRTAIACVLDMEPLDVPHFVALGEDHWWQATVDWFEQRGEKFYYLPLPIPDDWSDWWEHKKSDMGHIVLGGKSPRGPFGHVVVGTVDLETVHDPHPSRAGLTDVDCIYFNVKEAA